MHFVFRIDYITYAFKKLSLNPMFDECHVKDLLLSILTIPTPDKFTNESLNFLNKYFQNFTELKYLEHVESLRFRDFIKKASKFTITQINDSKLIIDVLSKINSQIKNKLPEQSEIHKLSILIFHLIINWMSSLEMNVNSSKNLPNFPGNPLMTSLLFIIQNSAEFESKAVSLFQSLFLFVTIKQASLPTFELNSTHLFISEWKELFQRNGSLHNSLQELLNFPFQLQIENPKFMTEEDSHELFNLIKYSISNSFQNLTNIDITALFRFQILSPQLSKAEIDSECTELLQSFIKYLSTLVIFTSNPKSDLTELVLNDTFFSINKLFRSIPKNVTAISQLFVQILNHSSHELCQYFPMAIKSISLNDDQLLSILTVLSFICDQVPFEAFSITHFGSFLIRETILFKSDQTIFGESFDINFLSLRFYFFRLFFIAATEFCLQLIWTQYQNDILHISEIIYFLSLITRFDFSILHLLDFFKDSYEKFFSDSNIHLYQKSLLKYFENDFNLSRQQQLFSNQKFLQFMFSNLYNDDHIHILIQIIELATTRIEKHPNEQLDYSLLLNQSIKTCKEISTKEIQQKYLYSLISFIGLVFNLYLINYTINDLYELIKTIEGDEPSSACFMSLMYAASKGTISSLRPEFLVYNPEFITLTLRCFSNSTRLPGFLQFFSTLCSFSASNCRSCHIGELDIELLNIVKKATSTTVINESFDLFQIIATVASSPIVVIKFISCLHPTCGRRRASPLMSVALKTIDSLFSSGIMFPDAYLPIMNEYPTIQFQNINSKKIQNGFTFISWVFIDMGSQTSPGNLFMISKDKKNILTVFIHTRHVFIYSVDKNGHDERLIIQDEIPIEKWTLIGLTFSILPNKSYSITTFINNKVNTINQTIGLNLKNQQINCSCGGEIDGGNKLKHPAFLSSVSLFSVLDTKNFYQISQSGLFLTDLNINSDLMTKLLFNANVVSENSILSLKNFGEFQAKLDGKITVQLMPFTQIFIKFFTTKTLLPVFALLSIQNLENKQDLALSAISAVLHSLQLSSNSFCDNFIEFSGFSLIAFLLSFVPECLTETFYFHVIDLLQNIHYEPLVVNLFDNLIFNEYLWSLSSIETQITVFKQWQLFQCHKLFQDFLYPTLYLYWINQNNPSVQTELIQFFFEKSKGITRTDLGYLLQACKSNNKSICLSILDLLINIDLTNFPETIFLSLNSILANTSETIIHKLCLLVIHIYQQKTNNLITLSEFFFLMAKEIKIIEVKNLDHFEHLINRYPEIVSICFSMISSISSMKQKAESLGMILLTLFESINLDNVYHWTYWPIHTALLLSNTFLLSVVEFISSKSTNLYETVILSMAYSSLFNDNTGNFVRELLYQKHQNIQKFVPLCFYFIFYFSTTKPLTVLLDFHQEEILESDLLLNIHYHNNEWKDKDLAIQCVDYICENQLKEFYDFALFLLPFVNSLTFYDKISETKKINKKIKDFVEAFINHNLTSKSIISAFKIINSKFESSKNEISQKIKTIQSSINNLLNSYQVNEVGPTFNQDAVEHQLKLEQAKLTHKWKSFWQSMTFDCSPWYSSDNEIQKKWKRADVLCTRSLIPTNMKINYQYTDHQEAALFRELGCLKWAQDKISEFKFEEKKKELASEYGPIPSLLKSSFSDGEDEILIKETEQKPRPRIPFKITKSGVLSSRFEYSVINSTIQDLTVECTRIKIADHKASVVCQFSLDKSGIELKFDKKSTFMKFDEINRIFLRAPLHHPCAIEIITTKGIPYFLVFPEKFVNTEITAAIANLAPSRISKSIQTISSAIEFFKQQGITEQWIKREISTFHYLMMLNHFSGRSFSAASMYPLFPWILSDYTSETLDLTNKNTFRDLSLPVGHIGKERFEALLQRRQEMESFEERAFMFSSYAVSPLITYLWLMRVEPFTTLHIDIQSGKFDHAARQFSSISDTYQMVTGHMNDFRELLPEFFFNKEFLLNHNEFDLGLANGSQIDQVVLPPWANNNAMAFIYYHRKALESEICSETIHHWIDLIWGVNSNIELNSYDPCLYEGIWTAENLNDRDKKEFIEATLQHCGQIPNRLFDHEHPKRNQIKEKSGLLFETLVCDSNLEENEVILFGTIKEVLKTRHSRNLANIDSNLNIDSIIMTFKILLITSNNRFIDFSFNQLEIDKNSSELSIVSNNTIWTIDFIDNSTSFAMYSYDEFVIANAFGKVQIVDPRRFSILSTQHHSGMTNCVAVAIPCIVSGGSDTVIACSERKKEDFNSIFSIPTYTNEVVCVAASKDFHVALSGTSGGFLIVQSLEKGKMTNYIDLKENRKPSQILVTRGWGFIVVYTTRKSDNNIVHEILVFTFLGDLIGQREIDDRLTRLITFTSHDGFDFVIMALANGTIAAFEAFYVSVDYIVLATSNPENGQETSRYLPPDFGCENNEIVLISYSIDKGNLLAVSKKGKIVLLTNVFFQTNRIMKI